MAGSFTRLTDDIDVPILPSIQSTSIGMRLTSSPLFRESCVDSNSL